MRLEKKDWEAVKKSAEGLLKEHMLGRWVNEAIVELSETKIKNLEEKDASIRDKQGDKA